MEPRFLTHDCCCVLGGALLCFVSFSFFQHHAVTSVKHDLLLAVLAGPSPSSYSCNKKQACPESIKSLLLCCAFKEQCLWSAPEDACSQWSQHLEHMFSKSVSLFPVVKEIWKRKEKFVSSPQLPSLDFIFPFPDKDIALKKGIESHVSQQGGRQHPLQRP